MSASRSRSSGLAAITARLRATKARRAGVKARLPIASRAWATASSGAAAAGAAAIASASSSFIVPSPKSTSRLSWKCRKKVLFVSPARCAMSITVVFS